MMSFDSAPTGWGTDSLRWSHYPQGVLPLWVADMDFAIAEPVRAALSARVTSTPLWYSNIATEHNCTVADYLAFRYNWEIDPRWVIWLPGVMVGVYQSVLMQPADAGVVYQTPLYRPLTRAALLRRAIAAPMCLQQGNWHCEWPQLEREEASLVILCHPHNPTGKVMSREELVELGDYAVQHNLLVLSDEIHADLTLDGDHHPFAAVCPELANNTITFMAASKTFNIAGLNTAFAIAPNKDLRETLVKCLSFCGEVTGLGLLATMTALTEGKAWRLELLDYLRNNRTMLDSAIKEIGVLSWQPNQASYLGWLNCASFNTSSQIGDGGTQLHKRLVAAGLALSPGSDFGDAGYVRINYATSRARLTQALEILGKVATSP